MPGSGDLASLPKPALGGGDIACIAAITDDEDRGYIQPDGALERVIVRPWDGDDDAVTTEISYVVMGPDAAPDLMRFLLNTNGGIPFGAFGVNDDGDISFYHTLIGNPCDKPELKTANRAVALVADKFDDDIVSRWGGQRAVDRVA